MKGGTKSRWEDNLTTTDTVQELQRKLFQKGKSMPCLVGESLFPDIVGIPIKSEEEMLSESRVRENFRHGLMTYYQIII